MATCVAEVLICQLCSLSLPSRDELRLHLKHYHNISVLSTLEELARPPSQTIITSQSGDTLAAYQTPAFSIVTDGLTFKQSYVFTPYSEDTLVSKLGRRIQNHVNTEHHCNFYRTPVYEKFLKLKAQSRLFRAVISNNTDAARELLAAGVSPHTDLPSKETHLHRAAYAGYGGIVKLLLENGEDPNVKDSRGYTPLHCAAMGNHVEAMALLMKANTQLSVDDFASNSPIYRAVANLNNMKLAGECSQKLQEKISQVLKMITKYMEKEPAILSHLFSVMNVKDSS